MSYIIVGLGNPGEEYEGTRHNTGAMAVRAFERQQGFSAWQSDKKLKALVSEGGLESVSSTGRVRKENVMLLLPQAFMNKSGFSVKSLVLNKRDGKKFIVVYDDLDLPIGRMKISFGRNSGGHKGVESVIQSLGTKEFVRVRIGIAPITLRGVMKKPSGEKKILDFIMGKFTKKEHEEMERTVGRAMRALMTVVAKGKEKAMQEFN